MHLPSNIWNSPVIRNRLFQEACFEADCGQSPRSHYWFIVPEADTGRNRIEIKNWKPSQAEPEPTPAQQMMAAELQEWLQKEVAHNGFWIVGWTHPPLTSPVILLNQDTNWRRLVMFWFDSDCDPKFPVEFERSLDSLMADGPDYFVEQAEKAYRAWNEAYGRRAMKDDFGIKDEQTTKAALAALH